jgi:hypothetical protein
MPALFFVIGFFKIGSCELFCLGWLRTTFLISFFWVARTIGVSHWYLVLVPFLENGNGGQDLGSACALCYWDITDSGRSQVTEWGGTPVCTNLCICTDLQTVSYVGIICVSAEHEFAHDVCKSNPSLHGLLWPPSFAYLWLPLQWWQPCSPACYPFDELLNSGTRVQWCQNC